MHLEESIIIHAPSNIVANIYNDYDHWAGMFPTISTIRLLCKNENKEILLIDHREGKVINILTHISPTETHLEEFKKHYDAQFLNRFESVPNGTRYTILADMSFKGIAKYIEPLLYVYVRSQIIRLVLEPIRQAAESDQKT